MSDHKKKKSYLSIFEEISKEKNGHHYPSLTEEEYHEEEETVLTDELDHEVLMHRDAHFAGDFKVMLAYYEQDGVGVDPDIDIERIAYLAQIEEQIGENLAPLILTGSEAELIARARRAYETLKDIYDLDERDEKSPFPRLLADLILTELEEPEEEIEAIVSQGTYIVPELIQIIKSDDAYNPLFPGYGYAPYLAILCLAKIGDPSAIIPLFETLGREITFDEEVILEALRAIGEPAKRFLLSTLQGRPITKDTINAAYSLCVFANQPEVAIACMRQLEDPEIYEKSLLRSYLLSNCEGIRGTPYVENLINLLKNPELPNDFRKEIEHLLHEWK